MCDKCVQVAIGCDTFQFGHTNVYYIIIKTVCYLFQLAESSQPPVPDLLYP